MFVVSFRLSGVKIIAGLLAVALLGLLGVTGVRLYTAKDTVETAAQETVPQTVSKAKKAPAKTNQQRMDFIRSFGWEVEEEPIEVLEVIIPKEFDEVYQQYNSMQKTQGYDLEKFAGKRVKRYSYTVTNYPGVDGEIRINLLVKDNKVIGGDVSSLNPDGFIHGFTKE